MLLLCGTRYNSVPSLSWPSFSITKYFLSRQFSHHISLILKSQFLHLPIKKEPLHRQWPWQSLNIPCLHAILSAFPKASLYLSADSLNSLAGIFYSRTMVFSAVPRHSPNIPARFCWLRGLWLALQAWLLSSLPAEIKKGKEHLPEMPYLLYNSKNKISSHLWQASFLIGIVTHILGFYNSFYRSMLWIFLAKLFFRNRPEITWLWPERFFLLFLSENLRIQNVPKSLNVLWGFPYFLLPIHFLSYVLQKYV